VKTTKATTLQLLLNNRVSNQNQNRGLGLGFFLCILSFMIFTSPVSSNISLRYDKIVVIIGIFDELRRRYEKL